MTGQDLITKVTNSSYINYDLFFASKINGEEIMRCGIDFILEDNIDGEQVAKFVMTSNKITTNQLNYNDVIYWMNELERKKDKLVFIGMTNGIEKVYCIINDIQLENNNIILISNYLSAY